MVFKSSFAIATFLFRDLTLKITTKSFQKNRDAVKILIISSIWMPNSIGISEYFQRCVDLFTHVSLAHFGGSRIIQNQTVHVEQQFSTYTDIETRKFELNSNILWSFFYNEKNTGSFHDLLKLIFEALQYRLHAIIPNAKIPNSIKPNMTDARQNRRF